MINNLKGSIKAVIATVLMSFLLVACGGGQSIDIDGTYYEKDKQGYVVVSENGSKVSVGTSLLGDVSEEDAKFDKSKMVITTSIMGVDAQFKVEEKDGVITLTEMENGKVTEDATVYYKSDDQAPEEADTEESSNTEMFNELSIVVPDDYERVDEGDDANTMSFRKESEGGEYPSTLLLNYIETSDVIDFSNKSDQDEVISNWIDGETFSDERNREQIKEGGKINISTECDANVDDEKYDASLIFINDNQGNVYVISIISELEDPKDIADEFYENLSYDFN